MRNTKIKVVCPGKKIGLLPLSCTFTKVLKEHFLVQDNNYTQFLLFSFYKVFPVNKKQEEIARKILDYLRKNPNAGDTLEGITKWWLEFERIDQSVDEIGEILDMMAQKGDIEKFCRNANNMIIFKAKRTGK